MLKIYVYISNTINSNTSIQATFETFMQKYQIKRVLGYREFIQISKFQIDDFIYVLYLHIYKRTKMNVMKSLASLMIYQNKENFVDFLYLFSFVNT